VISNPQPGRLVRVLDHDMWIVEHGSGVPVVMVHGIPTTSYLWRKVQRKLGTGCRTIAVDLIGLGQSQNDQKRAVGLEEQADAIAELCDQLELGSIVLVGHDVGGGVVHHFAAKHGARLVGVVLTDVVALPAYWPVPLIAAMRWPLLGGIAVTLGPFATILGSQVRAGFSAGYVLPAAVLHHYQAPLTTLRARRRFLAFVRTFDPLAVERALASYPEVPIRIVWGEQDRFQPVAEAEEVHHRLRGSTLRVVAGGHFLPEERPDVIADEIRLLLR